MLTTILTAGVVTLLVTPLVLKLADWAAAARRARAGPPPVPAAPDTPGPMQEGDGICHVIERDVAEFVITAFCPGRDSCRIFLNHREVAFLHWPSPCGVTLGIDDGAERLAIRFLGQDVPPIDDISVVFPGAPGDAGRAVPLADLARSETAAELAADLEWAAIAGQAGAARDSRPGAALVAFEGFDPDRETIELRVPPSAQDRIDVRVHPTEDGRNALVLVDSRPTAILRGTPAAGSDCVRVVACAADRAA